MTRRADADLIEALETARIHPLWDRYKRITPVLPDAPDGAGVWRWRDIEPFAARAAREVAVEDIERRALILAHPAFGGETVTTGNLIAAFTVLEPGDRAVPHRHTASAIRFATRAEGAVTIVNGRRCTMLGGDLVLTPPMCWHGHINEGGDRTVWFDAANIPLVNALHANFFEPGSRADNAFWEVDEGDERLWQEAGLEAEGHAHEAAHSPKYRYPGAATRRLLDAAPPGADGAKGDLGTPGDPGPKGEVGEAGPGQFHVGRIDVVADAPAVGGRGGHQGGPRTHERIEDQIVLVGVELDQAGRELHRERGGVPDPGGGLGPYLPDVECRLHEGFPADRGEVGKAGGLPLSSGPGAVEPALAGHDHPFGQVAEYRIGRAAPRSPRTGSTGASGLGPDDLTSQQEVKIVLEDAGYVRAEAPVGLATQVRHVDGDPSPRLQHPHTFGEHLPEEAQIVQVRLGYPAAGHRLLVLLSHEVRR